ncbi:MAG TPA: hypothetical protein VFA10_24310 [Ktedonobacteraceae bacterium]|nr:hypothetical protein [Ktedonobacteraceae bacterium]
MWQHMKAHGILPYSLKIGQRLIARYTNKQTTSQEKPPARRARSPHLGRHGSRQGRESDRCDRLPGRPTL